LNGDVFVDALRRLHAGDATALDDIGLDLRLPDDFVAYTRTGQPGHALADVRDIERYFQNVGTARLTRDPDLLLLLPRVGAVRRDMATAKGDPTAAKKLLGSAHKELNILRSRLHDSPTPSPLAGLILEDIDQFTATAKQVEQSIGTGAKTRDPEQWEPLVQQLEDLARRISQRLLALYRSAGAAPRPTLRASSVPTP
jgi:hypothetical protein